MAKVYLQKLQSAQNMAARMVSGVHQSEHITPVLEDQHWLPVSQRPWWSGSVFMVSIEPISATSAYPLLPSPVVSICDLQRLALHWSTRPDCNWTTKFCSQWTSHMEPSATSTTVTGPVGERLRAGTEDTPVLDCPAPLRLTYLP